MSFTYTNAYDPFAPDAMKLEATGEIDDGETEFVLVTGRAPKHNDQFEVQPSFEDCEQHKPGSTLCIGEQTSIPMSESSAIVTYQETCDGEKR